MSKVKQSCPICNSSFIVVIYNEGRNEAWPSCWKCGFQGHSEAETKALLVHVLSSKKENRQKVFDEATENWNEYLLLLKEEEKDKD